MPRVGAGAVDRYEIAVRQFAQEILPPPFPKTTVWGYGSVAHPATFGYPSCTIEARADRATRVTWSNQLVDGQGRYLRHLLPIDQTLHWANPPGGDSGRDSHGTDAHPYTGPVPIVTHVHGAHSFDDSDGFPESWFLPAATNIPAGYATVGSRYSHFRDRFAARTGSAWQPGTATAEYPNDQAAATLWYHDHTLGMTRANVYAGPAGFYLIRGGANDLPPGVLPGPAPGEADAPGTSYYEIPIVIQDRSFDRDGRLFYPDSRAFFEELKKGRLKVPFYPEAGCTGTSDISPIWNPEFFGNVMVVNGRAWPFLDVEQRRYRLRLLNGCNSRFLILRTDRPGLRFWQIGGDGGFLSAPVERDEILLAPAERADVIVDFADVPVGTEVILRNVAPDEPFGGGRPDEDFEPSEEESTGLVMQFRVGPARAVDGSTPPQSLVLPAAAPPGPEQAVRQLSLNELSSATVNVVVSRGGAIRMACDAPGAEPFGPTAGMLGTVDPDGQPMPMRWMDEVSENPQSGTVELWEIQNHTVDAHPVHIHLVMFEVVDRINLETGESRGPEPWERGPKDTVIAYPGETTRVRARFDRDGLYVWHCHILEHEDNEMMRPYVVGPI